MQPPMHDPGAAGETPAGVDAVTEQCDGQEPAMTGDEACLEDAAGKQASVPLTLEDVEAIDVHEMAKDKLKSKQLQGTLQRAGRGSDLAQLIFTRAKPCFVELVRDQHGNYLSQRILETATTEQFDELFALMASDLEGLAQDQHGTRAVQKLVELSVGMDQVAKLLEVLPQDLVERLARSVTGFHVIVKLLEILPKKEVEGLTELLCGNPDKVLALGLDQWGCCVLKKCVDCTKDAAREKIVAAITTNTLPLVQDPFGNYVVQHLIIMGHSWPNGSNPSITHIIDSLRGKIHELSLQKYSSNVLEKCLVNAGDKDRNKIINEILNPPNCRPSEAVRVLLFHRFGNYVFQQALEVAKDPQFSLLVEHSRRHVHEVIRTQSSESETPPAQPADNLTAEHARRLAIKLVKKYQPLSDGMDMELLATVNGTGWYGGGPGDPYRSGCGGFDPYGTWVPGTVPGYPVGFWGPGCGGYQPFTHPPSKAAGRRGGRGGGSGNGRARSQGRRGSQRAAKGGGCKDPASGQQGAEFGQDMLPPVGRIVGYWPNYSVTYEDMPASVMQDPAAEVGRKGRGKANKNQQDPETVPAMQ